METITISKSLCLNWEDIQDYNSICYCCRDIVENNNEKGELDE